MARFLRLLMTLVVLVSGPLSALGGTTTGSSRARLATADVATAHVGDSATSTVLGAVRSASRGPGGLLSILSRALADGESTGEDDEFEVGDAPDLFDDDFPQGFAAVAFSGLSIPRQTALYVERNLWGIQPSIGHPHGDDEPPRV